MLTGDYEVDSDSGDLCQPYDCVPEEGVRNHCVGLQNQPSTISLPGLDDQ